MIKNIQTFAPRFVLLLALIAVACDSSSTAVEDGEPTVEAYLIANEAIPTIRLTRTVPINSGFDPDRDAIRDATVSVTLEGIGESPDIEYPYVHDAGRPGIYEPMSQDPVLPGRTYHLSAEIEATSEQFSSTTIVPGEFEILSIAADTVIYQGDQYKVDISETSYPGRKAIFVQSIVALEPDPCELTPFYLKTIYEYDLTDEFDCTTFDVGELSDYLIGASPPLNEQNYETNPDGSLIVSLPWFAVVFYGEARVGTAAVDNAVYDFIRFQQAQQGGGTLSPGEIPNVLDHVDGGRGVFGSMARVESIMTVLRPE
jgi:hypothetical protein